MKNFIFQSFAEEGRTDKLRVFYPFLGVAARGRKRCGYRIASTEKVYTFSHYLTNMQIMAGRTL